jgi:hypothetical protein
MTRRRSPTRLSPVSMRGLTRKRGWSRTFPTGGKTGVLRANLVPLAIKAGFAAACRRDGRSEREQLIRLADGYRRGTILIPPE